MRRLFLLPLALILVNPGCSDPPAKPVTTGDFGQRTPAYFDSLTPIIDVGVDGQTGFQFIVDTGSPVTWLNSASFGHAQDYSASGTADLQAFNLSFSAIPTVTYGAFPADGCGDFPIDGFVGGDLLQFYALTVDYLGSALFLWDSLDGSPDIGQDVAPATTVKFHLRGGGHATVLGVSVDLPRTRILVDGMLEGVPSTFLVDTGASQVLIPQRVFDTLADQDRPRIADIPVQTAYGDDTASIIRLRSLSLGDVAQTDVPAFVTPDPTFTDSISAETGTTVVALVGGSFLRSYQTTIRYSAERLDLATYNNPVHVNPLEYVSPGFEIGTSCDGGIFVAQVFPGTSAAEQGIQAGFELLTIDTQPLDGLTIDEAGRLMHSYEVGSTVDMQLRGGWAVTTYTFTYSDLLPRFAQ